MKSAPLDYFVPTNVDEVHDLLNYLGDDAKNLARGQSLVHLLVLRLLQPSSELAIRSSAIATRLAAASLTQTPAAELPGQTATLDATFTAPAEFDSDIEPPAGVLASAAPRILYMFQPTWCAGL